MAFKDRCEIIYICIDGDFLLAFRCVSQIDLVEGSHG